MLAGERGLASGESLTFSNRNQACSLDTGAGKARYPLGQARQWPAEGRGERHGHRDWGQDSGVLGI